MDIESTAAIINNVRAFVLMAIMMLKSRSKADFWQKLGLILDDHKEDRIIYLDKTGTACLIVYTENDELLKSIKKHTKIKSVANFQHELNRKGFKKQTRTGTENAFKHDEYPLDWMKHLDSIKNKKPIKNRTISTLEEQPEDSENRARTLELELMQEREESKKKNVTIADNQKFIKVFLQTLKQYVEPELIMECFELTMNKLEHQHQDLFASTQPVNSAQPRGQQPSAQNFEPIGDSDGPNLTLSLRTNRIHELNYTSNQAQPPIHTESLKYNSNPKQQNKGEKADEETQPADRNPATLAEQTQFLTGHRDEPKSGHKIQTSMNQKSNRKSPPTKSSFINEDPSIMPIGNKVSAFLGKDEVPTHIEEEKINQTKTPFLGNDSQVSLDLNKIRFPVGDPESNHDMIKEPPLKKKIKKNQQTTNLIQQANQNSNSPQIEEFQRRNTQISSDQNNHGFPFEHFENNDQSHYMIKPLNEVWSKTSVEKSPLICDNRKEIQPNYFEIQQPNQLPGHLYRQPKSPNPLSSDRQNIGQAIGQQNSEDGLLWLNNQDGTRFLTNNPPQNQTDQRDSPNHNFADEFIDYKYHGSHDVYDPFNSK